MATKPTDKFTWATDANFLSGPDTGQPTKVNPAGYPAVTQGAVPGSGAVGAFLNKILNVVGQWTQWLDAGSELASADAHIQETDATGKAQARFFEATVYGTMQQLYVPGKLIEFPESSSGTTIIPQHITTTGAAATPVFRIYGQGGRAQTGAVDNNDGGELRFDGGARGLGGTGTTGSGFGGRAIAGPIGKFWNSTGNTAFHREYAENCTITGGSGGTDVIRIPLPNAPANYLIETRVVAIKAGGGTGQTTSVIKEAYSVRRVGSTLTINAVSTGGNPVYEFEDYTGTGPGTQLSDHGSGILQVEVIGADPDDVDATVYVDVYGSKESA